MLYFYQELLVICKTHLIFNIVHLLCGTTLHWAIAFLGLFYMCIIYTQIKRSPANNIWNVKDTKCKHFIWQLFQTGE